MPWEIEITLIGKIKYDDHGTEKPCKARYLLKDRDYPRWEDKYDHPTQKPCKARLC